MRKTGLAALAAAAALAVAGFVGQALGSGPTAFSWPNALTGKDVGGKIDFSGPDPTYSGCTDTSHAAGTFGSLKLTRDSHTAADAAHAQFNVGDQTGVHVTQVAHRTCTDPILNYDCTWQQTHSLSGYVVAPAPGTSSASNDKAVFQQPSTRTCTYGTGSTQTDNDLITLDSRSVATTAPSTGVVSVVIDDTTPRAGGVTVEVRGTFSTPCLQEQNELKSAEDGLDTATKIYYEDLRDVELADSQVAGNQPFRYVLAHPLLLYQQLAHSDIAAENLPMHRQAFQVWMQTKNDAKAALTKCLSGPRRQFAMHPAGRPTAGIARAACSDQDWSELGARVAAFQPRKLAPLGRKIAAEVKAGKRAQAKRDFAKVKAQLKTELKTIRGLLNALGACLQP